MDQAIEDHTDSTAKAAEGFAGRAGEYLSRAAELYLPARDLRLIADMDC